MTVLLRRSTHLSDTDTSVTVTLRVPFDVGPTGRIGRADTQYDVANQYLKVLLLTRLNERIMRPNYGSGVRDGVFEPAGEIFFQEIDQEIRDAISEWEPSISVHQIEIDAVGSIVTIDLLYFLNSEIGGSPQQLSVEISVGGDVEELG